MSCTRALSPFIGYSAKNWHAPTALCFAQVQVRSAVQKMSRHVPSITIISNCKPGEAHNIDDLRIFPYLLCLVIFSSYIPVVSVMFSLSLQPPHRHHVSSSLVHRTIIRWSCQFPGPTTSEAAVRRQPSSNPPNALALIITLIRHFDDAYNDNDTRSKIVSASLTRKNTAFRLKLSAEMEVCSSSTIQTPKRSAISAHSQ
jgi:hypothetical protein